MKHLLSAAILLAFTSPALAQYSAQGFFLGGHLNGTSWTLPNMEVEEENGGGLGITAGYGFNDRIALLLNLDGAAMTGEEGEDYSLGHLDLAGRFHFGPNRVKGYGQLGLSALAATWEREEGAVEVTGAGITVGAGFMYFFIPALALDINLHYLLGDLQEVKSGGVAVEAQEDVRSARFNIGVTWFPGR